MMGPLKGHARATSAVTGIIVPGGGAVANRVALRRSGGKSSSRQNGCFPSLALREPAARLHLRGTGPGLRTTVSSAGTLARCAPMTPLPPDGVYSHRVQVGAISSLSLMAFQPDQVRLRLPRRLFLLLLQGTARPRQLRRRHVLPWRLISSRRGSSRIRELDVGLTHPMPHRAPAAQVSSSRRPHVALSVTLTIAVLSRGVLGRGNGVDTSCGGGEHEFAGDHWPSPPLRRASRPGIF